jgi:hypothetical protein
MDKSFYREQAEKFRDYLDKFLLIIFEKWCKSKDFSDEDKQEIWMLVTGKTE